MGQVALLLKSLGHDVSGADQAVYPPISHELQKANLSYDAGYTVEKLLKADPDIVVVGNALGRGNPMIEWLLDNRKFRMMALPELIAEFLIADSRSIVVAGTHGKTTTTAATSWLLEASGKSPGYLMGGVAANFPRAAHLPPEKGYFVIEGDEYDSAFFDKRSKFIHYKPWGLILGNLEFDHADIFRDVADIQRSFSHLLRLVPPSGFILSNGDDAALEALFPVSWATHYRVGVGDYCDLQLKNYTEDASGLSVDLYWRNTFWERLTSPLIGFFNARNLAMSALAAGLACHFEDPTALSLEPLNQFSGVKRRQEVRYASESWVLVDDFAHHPTAIEGTLKAMRVRFPEHHLLALFEPRSNTTTRATFQETLPQSLKIADEVWVAPPYRVLTDGLRPDLLCESLNASGIKSRAFGNYELILESLKQYESQKPVALIVLSNGACGGIIENWISWKKIPN